SISGNTTPSANSAYPYVISVRNSGLSTVNNYTVKLMQTGDVELGSVNGISIAPGATVEHTISWTPTTLGGTQVWGKVVFAADENPNNNETAYMNVTVMAAGLQIVDIGTGTATQRFPLGSYYGYERSAALYTAAELGSQNTRISAISWYSSIATTAAVPTKIYLKTTGASTLTADTWDNMISGAVLLYDQSQTGLAAGDWNLFPLNGTFDVDQGDNLVILVERNFGGGGASTAGGSSAGGGIYSTPIPGGHLTWNADNNPPTTNGSVAANRPNVRFAYSTYTIDTPPNPAIVGSPTNAAMDVALHATLNWNSGGGGPTGYKLFLGTNNPPTNIQNNTDLGDVFTYEPTGLAYGTTYYWKIVPYNAVGAATNCPVWSFSTMADPTVASFPWTEGFEEDWIGTPEAPFGWSQITVSGANPWKPYSYSPHTGSFCAQGPWASAGGEHLLITPPLSFGTGDYRLKFWLKGSNSTSTDLKVQIASSSSSAANFSTDLEYYIAGTNMPTVWTEQTIDLDAYSGIQYIAFRLLDDNGYSLYIDDVRVEEIPLGPVALVTPDTWDYDTQIIHTTTPKEFTITNIGVGSLEISSINVTGTGFALAEAFTADPLLENDSASFTVNFTPQTAGAHSGMITINSNIASVQIPLSGDCMDPTVYSIPWTEGFETGNVNSTAVLGWMQEGTAGTSEWTANDTETGYNRSPHTGDWNAYLRYSNTRWMFRPVQLQGGVNYRATVWARQDGSTATNASIGISYGTEASAAGMTETILAPTGLINGDYQKLAGAFSPATSGIYYLGILGTINSSPWYISIDDISIEFPEPVPPEPVVATFPLNGSTTLLNPILKWTPSAEGEPASSYKVYLNQGGAFTETDLVYEGADLQYQTTDTMNGQGYFWKVAAVNNFGSTDSETWSFQTPGQYQLAESFEDAFPPVGWSRENYWNSSTSYAFHGTKSVYRSTSTTPIRMITPPLDYVADSKVWFQTYVVSSDTQRMQLSYLDGTTWTNVGPELVLIPGAWQSHEVDLGSLAGNSYQLGLGAYYATGGSGTSVYLDHVIGPEFTP
ncbi:MAG: choice-of-anchor D domain-containing protein, partial [Candidatus Cloacimonetes bacterium]|nr:choice-of-anchor D domain-containing protein [Candidatus Cloacimonadota bacterium]